MMQLRVGLLWHSLGHGNLGIDALSRANMAIIRSAASRADVKPHFVLLGTWGKFPADEPDVEQGPPFRLKRMALGQLHFLKALHACDVVFDTSEGDSFTDIYGTYRFLLQSGTKCAALLSGKPLVLSPQTIGPFRHTWTRAIAARLMKRTHLIFTRDQLSTMALNSLRVSERTAEAIDVAFRLPFSKPKLAEDGLLKIGVNVSGLLFSNSERFQLTLDYPSLIRRFLAAMTVRPNTEVWLIPHVLVEGAMDDDCAVSEILKMEFPRLNIAPRFSSSIDAKSFIAGLDMFTGGRMHACIAAFSAGVPVVPIAYSRKFNGLFQTLGYGRIVDGRSDSTDKALEILLHTVEERESAAVEVAACLPEAERRLQHYETLLVTVFKKVASLHG
jgi:colanic acid/amylovoran biosynthesis protein